MAYFEILIPYWSKETMAIMFTLSQKRGPGAASVFFAPCDKLEIPVSEGASDNELGSGN